MQNSKHPHLWTKDHPQWDSIRTNEWKLAGGTVQMLKPTEYATRELCSKNNQPSQLKYLSSTDMNLC
jgi:hypothetical protein